MAKKQVSTKKIKKKKWFPVIAPKILGSKTIGETLLTDSMLMKGRFMNVNLMNILGDPKKQNTNLQLRIYKVQDGKGLTAITKMERIASFTKRMVRRGRDKVEDSFLTKSKDGQKIRVKTLAVSNNYIPNSLCTKIRIEVRKIMKEHVSKQSFEKTVDDVLKMQILKEIKQKLTKITPVRTFEIKVLKIEDNSETEPIEIEVEETPVNESKTSNDSKPQTAAEKPKKETKAEEKKEAPQDKVVEEKKVEDKKSPVEKPAKAEKTSEKKDEPAKK
jgi:ribosomal protein S3AE